MDATLFKQLSAPCTPQEISSLSSLIEHDRELGLVWLSLLSKACDNQWIELNNVIFEGQTQQFLSDAVKSHDWAYIQQARQVFLAPWKDPSFARVRFESRIMRELMNHAIAIEHYDEALNWGEPISLEMWPLPDFNHATPIALQWQTKKFPGLWQKALVQDLKSASQSMAAAACAGPEVFEAAIKALRLSSDVHRHYAQEILGVAWVKCLRNSETHWQGVEAIAQAGMPLSLTQLDPVNLKELAQKLHTHGLNQDIARVLHENPVSSELTDMGMQIYSIEDLTHLHKAGIDLCAMKTSEGETFLHALIRRTSTKRRPALLIWCLATEPTLLQRVNGEGATVVDTFLHALRTPENEKLKAQMQAMVLQFSEHQTHTPQRPKSRL